MTRSSGLSAMIVASALLLYALSGCGSHDDIVGQWRTKGDSSGEVVWEFSKNGAVQIGNTRGVYSFGDRERIKIQTPFGTSVYQIELSKENMTLKEPNGSKLLFRKIK